MRRLRRVAALYGANPTFVLASATVAEPEVAAGRLTGLPVRAVTDDASPRGQVALALWEPPFVSHGGENGAPVRRSVTAELADLLTDLVDRERPHAGVRAQPPRCGDGVADHQAAARRGGRLARGPGRRLPRRLPARGAPRAGAGTALGRADRPGRDQRARARHRHLRPGRGAARRLPRDPGGAVAAGRPGRTRRRRRPRGAGRPRRPAGHLPGQPPRAPARATGRGDRVRPGQPLRPRPAPVRGGRGVAADRGRIGDLRASGP